MMSLLRSMLAVLVGSFVALTTSVVSADPPHVSYIFPAGGQQGTTIRFHVGGHYLRDLCPFEMLGSGIQGPA